VVHPVAGLQVTNGMFIRDAALEGLGVARSYPRNCDRAPSRPFNLGYVPKAPTSTSRIRATAPHRRTSSLSRFISA
jgi:hypothetical protein